MRAVQLHVRVHVHVAKHTHTGCVAAAICLTRQQSSLVMLPPVAMSLGPTSVLVGLIETEARGTPRVLAATWATWST